MLVSATWQHRPWARVLSRCGGKGGGPRSGAGNGKRARRRGHWFGSRTGHHAAHDHLIDHPVHLRAARHGGGGAPARAAGSPTPTSPRPPPHLLDVEDDVQLADVLKVAVERLDEHLRPHRMPAIGAGRERHGPADAPTAVARLRGRKAGAAVGRRRVPV